MRLPSFFAIGVIATFLQIMPITQSIRGVSPDYLFLAFLYGLFFTDSFSLVTACLLGFFVDVVVGVLFGLHAFVFSFLYVLLVNRLFLIKTLPLRQNILIWLFMVFFDKMCFFIILYVVFGAVYCFFLESINLAVDYFLGCLVIGYVQYQKSLPIK